MFQAVLKYKSNAFSLPAEGSLLYENFVYTVTMLTVQLIAEAYDSLHLQYPISAPAMADYPKFVII